MGRIIIKQIRSQIKRPKRDKDTLRALGLGRIGKQQELEATPQVRGMVETVRHLISVTEA